MQLSDGVFKTGFSHTILFYDYYHFLHKSNSIQKQLTNKTHISCQAFYDYCISNTCFIISKHKNKNNKERKTQSFRRQPSDVLLKTLSDIMLLPQDE